MRNPWLLLLLLPCLGCRGAGGEGFPSLLPRPAEAPRDLAMAPSIAPGLPPEMTQQLSADLDRDARAIAAAAAEIQRADALLAPSLQAARGAAPGSTPWVEAQMLLSRHDQARAGLGEARARLAALGPLLDGLPADDALLLRWKDLVRRAEELLGDADRRAREASRRLGG